MNFEEEEEMEQVRKGGMTDGEIREAQKDLEVMVCSEVTGEDR